MYSDPTGHVAITWSAIFTFVCYVFAVVSTVRLIEAETNIISDTVESLQNNLDDLSDTIEKTITSYVATLVPKKEYDSFERHHIVAKKDPRAEISRAILERVEIGINDPRNLVDVKKEYHRVLHTDLYYDILNTSMCIGYFTNGTEGVEFVLLFYRCTLGGIR